MATYGDKIRKYDAKVRGAHGIGQQPKAKHVKKLLKYLGKAAEKVALPTSGHIVTRVSVPTPSTRVHGPDQHRGWLVGALSSDELPRLVSLPSLTTQQEAA